MRPISDILELITLAHSLKVQYVKFGPLEVHFESSAHHVATVFNSAPTVFPHLQSELPSAPNDVPDQSIEQIVKPLSVLDEITDEEVLYYATPHYDQIQADKKAHEEQLKEGLLNG